MAAADPAARRRFRIVPPAVTPRLATTLLLLRDGPASLEVLMVERHVAVDFAAGALVFPGGRVEEDDADPAVLAHCREVAGATTEDMALRIAGIRETFEEVHVLLAREAGGEALLSAEALAGLEARLGAALGRPPIFAELVASDRIELATDLLVPYAHWITPAVRPKRYDTHFFLAPAPADQQPVHDGREAVESVWIAPERAIAEADAGRLTLVFVTRMNLAKLARSTTVAAALAAARADTIVTVCPEIADTPGGKVLRIPLAAGYGVSEFPVRTTSLA
jgi:8-oxo-dGTP pyrophosphatase MutT (NUDIX family)